MVLVGDVGALSASRLIASPTGPYHSAIVLCAYLEGLGPRETAELFRDSIYTQLGFYEAWNVAAAELLGTARDIMFPLEAELARWSRRGCFMHVLNHPKLFVLADIARRLAVEAGLHPPVSSVEDYLPDDLAADVVWPLYPDLAAHYGLTGTMLFKDRARRGDPKLYDLPAFIAASFAIYRRHAPEALGCIRVEGWRANPAVRCIVQGLSALLPQHVARRTGDSDRRRVHASSSWPDPPHPGSERAWPGKHCPARRGDRCSRRSTNR